MASPPPAAAVAAGASGSFRAQVGNAFMHRYYNILHQSPELVFRFYQDASRLGRPAKPGAEMNVVTTMEAINQKIMSMDLARAEIRAVDAQESLGGGVTMLVMGHLTRRTGASREFVQSFFLAPQEKRYFVLNDILRYAGEGEGDEDATVQPPVSEVVAEAAPVLPNGTAAGATALPREQDVSPQPEPHVAEPVTHPQEEEDMNEVEVYNPPNDAQETVVEETLVPEVIDKVPNSAPVDAPSSAPPIPVEEAPKKSYASIVKVRKEYRPPASTAPARPAPPKPEKQAPPAPAVADVPTFSSNPQSGSYQDPAVDAHAIYVRNLPMNATPQQLEE